MKAIIISVTLALPVFGQGEERATDGSAVGLQRYSDLWENSRFTEEPIAVSRDRAGVLADFTLVGVSPISGGYSVILVHKKNGSRLHLLPGQKNKLGLEVRRVKQELSRVGRATVEIATADGGVGQVTFERTYLALKRVSGEAEPSIPGLKISAQGVAPNDSERPPRVRRLPTPTKK